MYSDQLIYALLNHDHHDALARNRSHLERMLSVMPETVGRGETTYRHLLKAIVMFDKARGKCPTPETLKQFLLTIDGEQLPALANSVALELDSYASQWEELKPEIDDVDLLIAETIKEVRAWFWEVNFLNARTIATNGMRNKKGDLVKGPEAAFHYLAQQRSRDLQFVAPIPAGTLHENSDLMFANLKSAMTTNEARRWKLGFNEIDKEVLIGRGPNMNRFIGALGHSGDGKSTVLHTIVNNLAAQGANVLYNSLEHDPEELWEIQAFLCYEQFMDRFALPPRKIWDSARGGSEEALAKLKPQHLANIEVITTGLKNRTLIPGVIDCQRFTSWAEIIDYMTVNDRKYHYDVLVIDYIGNLSLGCDPRFEQQARKTLIHECQTLTRTWNNNQGIVLISPIQVNRAGKEAADKKEIETERRYKRDAIREYSEFCHDMDFVFSIWSDDAMKVDCKIELDVVKHPRKGDAPHREFVYLDKRTGKVTGEAAKVNKEAKAEAERTRRMMDAMAVMEGRPEPVEEIITVLPEDVY